MLHCYWGLYFARIARLKRSGFFFFNSRSLFTCGFYKYPFHRPAVALYVMVTEKCCVSPILFNLHKEYLIKEAVEGFGDNKRTSNSYYEICG